MLLHPALATGPLGLIIQALGVRDRGRFSLVSRAAYQAVLAAEAPRLEVERLESFNAWLRRRLVAPRAGPVWAVKIYVDNEDPQAVVTAALLARCGTQELDLENFYCCPPTLMELAVCLPALTHLKLSVTVPDCSLEPLEWARGLRSLTIDIYHREAGAAAELAWRPRLPSLTHLLLVNANAGGQVQLDSQRLPALESLEVAAEPPVVEAPSPLQQLTKLYLRQSGRLVLPWAQMAGLVELSLSGSGNEQLNLDGLGQLSRLRTLHVDLWRSSNALPAGDWFGGVTHLLLGGFEMEKDPRSLPWLPTAAVRKLTLWCSATDVTNLDAAVLVNCAKWVNWAVGLPRLQAVSLDRTEEDDFRSLGEHYESHPSLCAVERSEGESVAGMLGRLLFEAAQLLANLGSTEEF